MLTEDVWAWRMGEEARHCEAPVPTQCPNVEKQAPTGASYQCTSFPSSISVVLLTSILELAFAALPTGFRSRVLYALRPR